MNILIFCNILSRGGAERVAVSYANGLCRLGHTVYILADTSVEQTYETDTSITIIPTPLSGSKGSFLTKIRYRLKLISFIRDLIDKYEITAIVKVMHVYAVELLIAKSLSKNKPPIIMTDHNAYERPSSAPMPFKIYFQKFILNRLFNKVTVLTQRDKQITDRHHLHNVVVLNNPLFIKTTNTSSSCRGNTILAVGGLDRWHVKGFDVLIKAWNSISQEFPDWKLRIAGHGSMESKMYLNSLSISNNQFEIVDFNSDIVNEYRQSSIFVLSSRYEGWGLVLIEAMSQGCACIACDFRGRQREIITSGENGIICEPDDVANLAFCIKRLICEPDLRAKLQQNAVHNLESFSEEATASHLEDIIRQSIR